MRGEMVLLVEGAGESDARCSALADAADAADAAAERGSSAEHNQLLPAGDGACARRGISPRPSVRVLSCRRAA